MDNNAELNNNTNQVTILDEVKKNVVIVDDKEYAIKEVPYADVLECAREMVGDIVVCDEDTGSVYERYDKEARFRYYYLKYFTDYPITGDEDYSWKLSLVDRMKARMENTCIEYDLPIFLYDAYDLLYKAVEKKFVGRNSIGTKLLKTFGSILGDEDLAKTVAESRTVSENMLDLIQKAKLFDENHRDAEMKDGKDKIKFLRSLSKRDID